MQQMFPPVGIGCVSYSTLSIVARRAVTPRTKRASRQGPRITTSCRCPSGINPHKGPHQIARARVLLESCWLPFGILFTRGIKSTFFSARATSSISIYEYFYANRELLICYRQKHNCPLEIRHRWTIPASW